MPMNAELEAYIASHIEAEPRQLKELDREANLCMVNPRMSAGHLQGRLLKMLVQLTGAKRVLELGTFAAYSALCMAEGCGPDGVVTTIENSDEREDFIRRQLASSPYGQCVRLIIGDALEQLGSFAPASFDFVLIDADKRQYADYFRAVLPLVREGGLIVADNTLWGGHLLDQAYGHDPQTLGIREFNDLVAATPEVEAVILPVRDGLTLIRKKNKAPHRAVINTDNSNDNG